MELWSPEIERLRPEARQAVAEGIGGLRALIREPEAPPSDPLERARAARLAMARAYAPVPEATERTIAGVACRVFVPDGAATAVYLHFHGGGMILGAPEMNDIGNLQLCRRLGLAVVSADYRKAPEHPYPAGPDDGLAVAAWLLDHAEDEFGSGRILVGGESAGGYMAAAVLLRIRDELGAASRVDGANLTFGVYDWGRSPSQRGIRPVDGPDILDPEGIRFFSDCYLPGRTDDERRDPAVSPAFADLRGLPPAFMSVGTADHLLDDTLMLAGRWAAAGGGVDLFVAPDLPHGFMAFPCGITTRWAERMSGWFKAVLAAPPRAG
ncbi:MAG TPA: alpha/beta hydrolase [Acidimicrobiales bacterium]